MSLDLPGVYLITFPDGMRYVGMSTVACRERFNKYKEIECKGQPKLYEYLKRKGTDNMRFTVLETRRKGITKRSLERLETYYMKKFNTVDGGLNCKYSYVGMDSYDVSQDEYDDIQYTFTYDYPKAKAERGLKNKESFNIVEKKEELTLEEIVNKNKIRIELKKEMTLEEIVNMNKIRIELKKEISPKPKKFYINPMKIFTIIGDVCDKVINFCRLLEKI